MLMPTYAPSSSGGGGTLIVKASPASLQGYRYGAGTVNTSTSSNVLVTNAVGAVTYLWELVSGASEIGPVNGLASSTRFFAYIDLFPYNYNAVWRCKVTDSASNVGYSNPVNIDLETLLQDGGGGQLP